MKDRKKLMLQESATRRFMKLANIGSLSEGFFDKINEIDIEPEEEEELPGPEEPVDEPGGEFPPEEPSEEVPLGEPEDVPLGEPGEEEGEEMVSKLDRVVDALEDLLKGTGELGPEDSLTLSVGGDAEDPEGELEPEELPGEEELGLEPPVEEPPELEETASGVYKRDDVVEETEDLEEDADSTKISEDVINEVTRRVAMRIIQAMKKNK